MSVWFRAKSLASEKKHVVNCDNLWEISHIKGKVWSRKPFGPKSAEEFYERSKKEKLKKDGNKTEYGVLEGEYMYRYVLLKAADTREALSNEASERLQVPKRLSTSDTKIPVAYFLAFEEKMAAKKERKDYNKKSKDETTSADIIKRFKTQKGKEKTGVSTGESSVVRTAGNPLKGEQISNTDDGVGQNEEKFPFTEKNVEEGHVSEKNDEEVGLTSEINEEEEHSGMRKQKVPLSGRNDESNKSIHTESEVQLLKKQVEMLTAQLEEAKKSKATTDVLHEIAAETKRISERVGSKNKTCNLNLRMAIPLQPEHESLEISDGYTYVGGEVKLVPHTSLARIDESGDSFYQKGEELFKLIVGKGIEHFSKTKKGFKANPKLSLNIMPPTSIDAFKTIILEAFEWVEKPTSKEIAAFLRKQPWEARRRFNMLPKKPKRKLESPEGHSKKKGKNRQEDENTMTESKKNVIISEEEDCSEEEIGSERNKTSEDAKKEDIESFF